MAWMSKRHEFHKKRGRESRCFDRFSMDDSEKRWNILAKLKYEASGDYSGVDILEDPNIEVPPAP